MGAIVGLEIINLFPFGEVKASGGALIFLIGCLSGSVAPDLDDPNSKVSRVLKLSFLANILQDWFGGHRGFSHILLMPFLFLLFVGALIFFFGFSGLFTTFFIGMSVGITTHHLGDLFTKSRINAWSNPFAFTKKIREESEKEGIPLFKVGGAIETWFITPILILLLLFIVCFQMNAKLKGGILF